jgi:lysylphosphatidylglycerol synthetase-like protein (DUF2156 family)
MAPPARGAPAAAIGVFPPAPSVADRPQGPALLPVGAPTPVPVGIGQRVMVVGDLLLNGSASASSTALAADLASTLDGWEGPGTVVVCGNLFAGDPMLDADRVRAALAAHPDLAGALRRFAASDGRRVVVLPGWRDPEVASDPGTVTELYGLGAEVAPAVELRLATAAGERTVLVCPGRPTEGEGCRARCDASRPVGARPWLSGIDRLEDPATSARFVTSRTLYRRLARVVWVPPLLALVAALALRTTLVYHGVERLVRRSAGPSRALAHAYTATWPARIGYLLAAVAVLEALAALVVTVASRRAWRAAGGGALPPLWGSRPVDADAAPPGTLEVGGVDAHDQARAVVGHGATGLVTGGGLRAELTHLGTGFYACAGGTTEVVREHRGRLGLPPVFLHHRQVSWIELETGADLHVRLLLAESGLPSSATLERLATGHPGSKRRRGPTSLHPEMVASWPRGPSWPPTPAAAADRVRTRRVRRLAAGAIFLAGVVDLVVAVSRPAAGELRVLREFLPLSVAQAAGALVALAGIALVMLARGVLRGQRRAWLVATALLVASLVLHLLHGGSVGVLLLTAVVLGVLVAERDLFGAAADHGSTRSAAATLALGVTAAVLAAWAGAEADGRLHHSVLPSWPLVLLAVTERLGGLHTVALPDAIGDWVSPGMLAVGVALAVVTLYLLTRPVVDRTLSSEEAGSHGSSRPHPEADESAPARSGAGRRAAELRARDIVRRHGTGTLDYFALRDDKRWFFHRDTLVAYAVYGGVCVVSPDPIGPVVERRQAWHAFRRYCDRRGWGVAVMAAAEDWLPLYRDDGMRHLYLGDEAVVDVQRFSLQGGQMKGVRQAVHRVARYGYTVRFLNPANVTPEVGEPLVALMGHNRRGEHERGFSMMLGRIFDRRDNGLLLTVVDGPDGTPVAMCQFVPSGAIGGYSLDLMRRDPGEHPNGLIDFALCSTIEHLRQEGGRGLSLNFAAMRSVLEGETGDGVSQRVERWALRRMSGVLQIESLWRFNAKYEPDWLPRSVVYDSPELIAPTLVAILRAESLTDVPVVGRFLVPAAARR